MGERRGAMRGRWRGTTAAAVALAASAAPPAGRTFRGIAWPAGLFVRAGPTPGLLLLGNAGVVPVRVDPAVSVEGYDGRGWAAAPTTMSLVPGCPGDGLDPVLPPATLLAPGAAIATPPWLGWTCSSQCREICRANAPLGRGPWRFRVRLADGESVVTDAFLLPPVRD